MPGRFYRIDAEIAAAGVERLAPQALACATLEAAHRKGWAAAKAMARASKLIENAALCCEYLALFEQPVERQPAQAAARGRAGVVAADPRGLAMACSNEDPKIMSADDVAAMLGLNRKRR